MVQEETFVFPVKPWMEISKRVHLYDSVYYKQQVMDNSTSVMENIGWQPLTMGWIQLNTGGATRVNSVYG
jgi:hypothetical protein